jgi:hypothetical protein
MPRDPRLPYELISGSRGPEATLDSVSCRSLRMTSPRVDVAIGIGAREHGVSDVQQYDHCDVRPKLLGGNRRSVWRHVGACSPSVVQRGL